MFLFLGEGESVYSRRRGFCTYRSLRSFHNKTPETNNAAAYRIAKMNKVL